MANHGIEELADHRWVSVIGPVSEADVLEAEMRLGRRLPALVRRWITTYGSVSIDPEVEEDPFLHLLGTGPMITDEEDIVLFNYPNNPSRPDHLTLFAHEFNGDDDLYYTVDSEGCVYAITNGYAWHYFTNKDTYTGAGWQKVYESVEAFWSSKVNDYLNGEGFS